MASRALRSLVNLFFYISLATILSSHRVSSKEDFVKIDATFEGPINCSNLARKNSINIVHNKTSETIRTMNKTFAFQDISLINASLETWNENVKHFSQHTGYVPIRHSYGARLFYFFFESRGSKNDPIVLWLTGGPGVGSLLDLFYVNGPFHIDDDLSLKWNDFGWDKVCNLLYVDQPNGAGFSYSSDHRDIRRNSKQVCKDLYDFLQAFFQAHPNLLENDFYIAGSSYSGHTIPLLASQIHKQKKAKEGNLINLKGFAISNGLTNPKYTHSSFPEFIYNNKLINRSTYYELKEVNKECLMLIRRCQTDDNICKNAHDLCLGLTRKMMGQRYWYHFKKQWKDLPLHDFSRCRERFKKFLALNDVRSALGVGNRTYVSVFVEAEKAMAHDYAKNYAGVIPSLLNNGIKVLILDGEYDAVTNWLGNLRWTQAMKWNDHSQYVKTKSISYKLDGKEVGKVKNIGPLTFLKVFNAGHEVTMDQPYVSLQILKNWMNS